MRNFVIGCFAFVLCGCGLHATNTSSVSALGVHKTSADVGLFHSSSTLEDVPTSFYERCMVRYRGYDQAKSFCDDMVQATSPYQMPRYGYGLYGPYTASPAAASGILIIPAR